MKKIVYLSLLVFGVSLGSCKKCATCTSTMADSAGQDSTITSEFCDKGNVYDNELYQHERSGWICTED